MGIPLLGLLESVRLFALIVRSPTRVNVFRALLGLLVVAGIVWFNWTYHGIVFFDLLGRQSSRGL